MASAGFKVVMMLALLATSCMAQAPGPSPTATPTPPPPASSPAPSTTAPMVTVVSFGGPRVGNTNFRSQMEKSGTKILRIVNSDDVITKVPGFVIENNDVAVKAAGLPMWVRKRVEAMQLGYADVGQELRLSSRESPYLNKNDVAACHDLKTYLHLVDGFVSSTCPFRATATRMLERQSREKAFT